MKINGLRKFRRTKRTKRTKTVQKRTEIRHLEQPLQLDTDAFTITLILPPRELTPNARKHLTAKFKLDETLDHCDCAEEEDQTESKDPDRHSIGVLRAGYCERGGVEKHSAVVARVRPSFDDAGPEIARRRWLREPMHKLIVSFSLLALPLCVAAAELDYPSEVAKWQEVPVPPRSDEKARHRWAQAANFSQVEWEVFAKNGELHARLAPEVPSKPLGQPTFPYPPGIPEYEVAPASIKVHDGWLVGFNVGEFGAALYWFSPDTKRSYKISDHQVLSHPSIRPASLKPPHR